MPTAESVDWPEASRIVFFDLETTSEDPEIAEIVEIAAYRQDGSEFHRYVVTEGLVPEKTYEITHIDRASYEAGRIFPHKALRAFLDFVGDCPLAGHNIEAYDLPILRRALTECNLDLPSGDSRVAIDTLPWARVLFPTLGERGDRRLRNHKLGSLYEFLIGQPLENAHRATADCAANARIFQAFLNEPVEHNLARLWHHLRLPFARFYPGEGEPNFSALLHTQANIERIQSPGPTFPPVSQVFPEWLDHAVQDGRVAPERLNDIVRDLASDSPVSVEAHALLSEQPTAARDARYITDLAGSYRIRQTDGVWQAPQAQMARHVARGLEEFTTSVVQAPTGTGKTKAYLAAAYHAATAGTQVVIATHTKVLQRQVLDELADYSHHFATNALSVRSARKFVCPDALLEALQTTPTDSPIEIRLGLAMLVQLVRRREYDLESVPPAWSAQEAYRELEHAVETHSYRCHPQCAFFGSCAYQAMKREREQASILVTNQAWLLATMAGEEDQEQAVRPHLIIDEAHNLEDVATEAFSERYSSEQTRFQLRRLFDPERQRGALSVRHVPSALSQGARTVRETLIPAALEALKVYDSRVERFVKQHARGGDPKFGYEVLIDTDRRSHLSWELLRRDEDGLITALTALNEAVWGLMADPAVARRTRPVVEEFRKEIDFLYRRRRATQEETIHTIHWSDKKRWEHVAHIVDLSGPLHRVWERAASVTLTSATLAPDGRFGYFLRTLGLPEGARTLSLPEGLPYEEAFVLLPAHLPAARHANATRFQAALHEDLTALLPQVQRSLTLFTSTSRMVQAGEALKELAPLVPISRSQRDDVVERMQEDGARHTLGTRAFMEGVNFPHLRLVSLERIPFPIPDALTQARQRLASERGNDPWYDFYLPKAMLTFTQAFGRLIRDDRSSSGRGLFVLWDKRILSASYREVVYGALPASVLRSGNLRRPTDRSAFYTEVAGLLDLSRDAFPITEWTDEKTQGLRNIQQRYAGNLYTDDEAIQAMLKLYWPPRDLKPGQRQAIAQALRREDVLALLPTGYGKSLAFQIPALLQQGLTLVVSPLIALMDDQVNDLRELGVPAAAIHAMKSGTEQRGVIDEAKRGELHLLYVSPERILRSNAFRNFLRDLGQAGAVKRVVFDEAHCLSEWGHDFRPDYGKVKGAMRELGIDVPISAFTATAAPTVRDEIQRMLDLKIQGPVWAPSDRPNLTYHALKIKASDAVDTAVEKLRTVTRILSWLRNEHPNGVAIIYVATRAVASRLAASLSTLGFSAGAYHAGQSPALRQEVQEQFKAGQLMVMVATNAFGMGVDQRNVRAVIHFHPPKSLPAYLQEAGRAGRDGEPAWAVLLHDWRDWQLHRWLARQNVPRPEHAEALVSLLNKTGTLSILPEGLLERLTAELPLDSEPVEMDDLNPLLATLDEADVVRLDYRPGHGRLVSQWSDDQFKEAIGPHLTTLLMRAGFQPGPRPAALDFKVLESRDDADSLNAALYRLTQERPNDVLYMPSIPALELTPLRARLTDFHVIRDELVDRKARDLKAMRDYADATVCRRLKLLKAFNEAPIPREMGHGCCDTCTGSYEPWATTRAQTDEDLVRAYRVETTVLSFLKDDFEQFQRRYPDRPYSARGATRISMILRGEAERFVGKAEKLCLRPSQRRSPYYGRLEFVPDREVKNALNTLTGQAFVEQTAFAGRPTYAISDLGRHEVTRLERRLLGEARP